MTQKMDALCLANDARRDLRDIKRGLRTGTHDWRELILDPPAEVPYGYCHCGCGEKTAVAKQTCAKYGHVKGEPVRFIVGHHAKLQWRPSAIERFVPPIEEHEPTGCWLWLGTLNTAGYPQFRYQGKMRYAHRWAYEYLVGPIPDGLQLDHLCRTPRCVNPVHLEPVTPWENNRRSNSRSALQARQTHCRNGHPLTGANLILDEGKRRCRECRRANQRHRYRIAQEAKR